MNLNVIILASFVFLFQLVVDFCKICDYFQSFCSGFFYVNEKIKIKIFLSVVIKFDMFAHKNNIMPVLKRSSKEKAPKRDFLFLQVVLWYLLTEVHVAGISWTFFASFNS